LNKLGHPLNVFGNGAFFQPYIPLQQIDILMAPETKSFIAGTSNRIFVHQKACNIEAVVNVPFYTLILRLILASSKF
jgi:hypothetical protein